MGSRQMCWRITDTDHLKAYLTSLARRFRNEVASSRVFPSCWRLCNGSLRDDGGAIAPSRRCAAQFVVRGDAVGAMGAGLCHRPLEDPRDGTRLVMQRSGADVADYAVPSGRYGVAERELLRVRCSTREPLGIVRR